ncbi:MAG: arylamine N-acetyltransferase [Oscillospiraceae bacterium]
MEKDLDFDLYLKRIGYLENTEADLQTLSAVMQAQLMTVPFENLDIVDLKRGIDMDPAHLFEKIVTNHRGGFCFELNKLFYLLLKALDYNVYPVAARVVWRRDNIPPLSHRASIVTLNGQEWFSDVGFGGPGPKAPLCLSTDEEQNVSGEIFRAVKSGDATLISKKDNGGWMPILSFGSKPFEETDFSILCYYFSTSSESVFTQRRIVNICLPNGYASIQDNFFTLCENGCTTISEIKSQDELKLILRNRFGIDAAL